jgi:hypothetical protein
MLQPTWTIVLLFVLPGIAEMTSNCYHAQALVKMGLETVSW